MGITVTDLTTLSQTSVDQFQTQLTTLLQEYQPDVDVKGGLFEDLLLHLKAVLDAATQENIDLIRQANSLQQVTANPSLADPTITTALLSNFNLKPNPGTKASGPITIVLSQLIGTVIPSGSVFTINGLTFTAPVSYGVRTSQAAVIAPTDVLISQIGTNKYAFTINVTATAVGANGNVMRGLTVIPTQLPAAFVKAYVQSDFTGGTDASTNAELLTMFAAGLAIGAWSNRTSSESLIRKQTNFANISNLSIIGFGDPEMLRDQHSIWPGATGGRADLYLRSQALYSNVTITKTATLVGKTGPIGTWQFGIARDDAPGFYQVDRILFPGEDVTDVGFTPSSDIRGFDLSGVTGPPDIVTAQEAVYSRYQTAVIQFNDTVTDATALVIGTSKQNYSVVLRTMPLVGDVQDFLNGRSVRPPMGDVEVKAPIPCYTSVTFTVNYKAGTTVPSIPAIQNAVAAAVNALNFPGSLSASLIDQVLHNLLSNLVSVTGVTLNGTIRCIDGSTTALSNSVIITIPSVNNLMQSGRTVAFFLRPTDVHVTLVAV